MVIARSRYSFCALMLLSLLHLVGCESISGPDKAPEKRRTSQDLAAMTVCDGERMGVEALAGSVEVDGDWYTDFWGAIKGVEITVTVKDSDNNPVENEYCELEITRIKDGETMIRLPMRPTDANGVSKMAVPLLRYQADSWPAGTYRITVSTTDYGNGYFYFRIGGRNKKRPEIIPM